MPTKCKWDSEIHAMPLFLHYPVYEIII